MRQSRLLNHDLDEIFEVVLPTACLHDPIAQLESRVAGNYRLLSVAMNTKW
jgi:hypothetical protein